MPILTGERLEPSLADYYYEHSQLLIQCEQQENSLQALVHVKKDFYHRPQFIHSLSKAFSSLDRVNSQLINFCGIIIYDPVHCINIKTFNQVANTSQICEFSVYPFFPSTNANSESTPPDSTLSFERVIGNARYPYMFDNLQVEAEAAYEVASNFYLSIL